MLKQLIYKLKTSSFGELVSRGRSIYGIFDRRGKRILLLVYASHVASSLIKTMSFLGLGAFFIVLGKPDMVLDHPYMVAAYDILGFESRKHFLLLISGILTGSIIFQQIISLLSRLLNTRLMGALTRRCVVMMYGYHITQSYEDLVRTGTTLMLTKQGGMLEGMITDEINKTKTLFDLLINGLFVSGILFFISTWAVLIMLLVVALFFYSFFMRYQERARILGKSDYKKTAEKTRTLKETSSAAIEIKVMGKEREFVDRVQEIMVTLLRNKIKKEIIQYTPDFLLRVSGVLLLYVVAGITLFSKPEHYTFPTLIVFAVATFRLLPILQSFYTMLIHQENTRHKYLILIEDLKKAKETYEKGNRFFKSSRQIRIKNAVVFDTVTFSYSGKKDPVIHDLSMSLPANNTIVLFGESGAGKTTLVGLISGLLVPQKGKILIDGKSLHEDEAFRITWQQSFGICFQKPFFMDSTLAMNIAFESEKKKIDYDRIREVVKLAQLEELVENLPDGVDTELAEEAGTLSGGQRQRISIARALYRNSPILVFDEATNAIDLTTEREIISSLLKASENKLIIIISHRTEMMRFSNMVLFMKKDKSIAQGSFDQLIEEEIEFKNIVTPMISRAV